MATWSGLGADPVPGDVDAVKQIARKLGAVGEHAEQAVGGVRGVDASTAPAVWKGPAADSFRRLLGEIGPRLTELATAYDEARAATMAYSAALAAAQEKARAAEVNAEGARRDHDVAQREHNQAIAESGGWKSKVRALELRLVDAGTRLADPIAAINPTYHAQLLLWRQQIATQRAHAATRHAEAEGRMRASDVAMHEAEAKMSRARALACEAAEDVERAARALAAALGPEVYHSQPRIFPWQRFVEPVPLRPLFTPIVPLLNLFKHPVPVRPTNHSGSPRRVGYPSQPHIVSGSDGPPPVTPTGPVTTTIEQGAAHWAIEQRGKGDWPGLCLTFVYEAYEHAGMSRKSLDAASGLVVDGDTYPVDQWEYWMTPGHAPAGQLHVGLDSNPPVGAIIYYDNTCGYPSHVTISLGGGQEISPSESGVSGPEPINAQSCRTMLGWWLPDATVSR